MLLNIQKYLSKYVSKKCAYRIVYYSYAIVSIIPIALIGYYMKVFPFILMCMIIINLLRKYTFGLHFTNGKCLIFTYCMVIMFSYLYQVVPNWVLIGGGLFSMRDIYIRSPLRLTVKGKNLLWHESKILLILGVLLIISSISLIMNVEIIERSIMCSIIMVDLTLFENKQERGCNNE